LRAGERLKESGRGLTYFVDRRLAGHTLRDAGVYIQGVVCTKQRTTQFRVIADEDARVKVAVEQVLARIFEECFCEALETYPLIHVAQFFCLRIEM
jgi:hypothetical protein